MPEGAAIRGGLAGGAAGQGPVAEIGVALGEEFRRDERYPVHGDAEVVVIGGTLLFRSRIMDISISGCYIQTLAWVRLRPETRVEILFAMDGKIVHAIAASRYAKSKVGIGFRFLPMNAEMQARLDDLIEGARTRFMELTRLGQTHRLGGRVLPADVPSSSGGYVPRLDAAPQTYVASPAASAIASETIAMPGNESPRADGPRVEGRTEEASELGRPFAPPVHSFDVDEDASEAGHAEVWSAASGANAWRGKIGPRMDAPAEVESRSASEAAVEAEHVAAQPAAAVEHSAGAEAGPYAGDVSDAPALVESGGEGDLQQVEELLDAHPGTADERAERSDGEFAVLGN